jgi:D-aminopeptidase
MTKLEAWKAWNEAVGVGMEATEYALEKSSHGKAFSYAWDAAVKAEREACAKVCERLPETFRIAADEFGYQAEMPTAENYAAAIRARGEA